MKRVTIDGDQRHISQDAHRLSQHVIESQTGSPDSAESTHAIRCVRDCGIDNRPIAIVALYSRGIKSASERVRYHGMVLGMPDLDLIKQGEQGGA